MTKNILILMILTVTISCSGQSIIDSLESKAKNNQVPERWNMELFNNDKKSLKETNSKPINSLAFPVEKYEYYVFNKSFNFETDKEHFSGISFGENTGGKEDKFIFKHELTIIFYTGAKNYQVNGDVSSRNFPYLTIQGQLELNNIYDFVGVKSPENAGYLIVNLKSFDLRFGQTVIIFPNDDNSFFYLQSDEKPSTGENFNEFLNRIKSDNRIKEMINKING
ncbi:MAG: hypothetical protein ACI815_001761 [Psychroserpens sp.]|jgi:hypothetical protein